MPNLEQKVVRAECFAPPPAGEEKKRGLMLCLVAQILLSQPVLERYIPLDFLVQLRAHLVTIAVLRCSEAPIATTHHSFPGSFSAVSKPIFASKYSFFSMLQDLQDFHNSALLESQSFDKISSTFSWFWRKFHKILEIFKIFENIFDKFLKILGNFLQKIEFRAAEKYANLEDL